MKMSRPPFRAIEMEKLSEKFDIHNSHLLFGGIVNSKYIV